jgi:hypothetical protein
VARSHDRKDQQKRQKHKLEYEWLLVKLAQQKEDKTFEKDVKICNKLERIVNRIETFGIYRGAISISCLKDLRMVSRHRGVN